MKTVYRKSLLSTVVDKICVRLTRGMANRRKAHGAPRMFFAPDDYIGETILAECTFEKGYLGALDTIVHAMGIANRPGSVALDIGANIGNHSLHFARTFARVHSFDPNPMISRVLEANVMLNEIENITVHRVALSDMEETLPYIQHDSNLGGSGFQRDGKRATEAGARDMGVLELHHAGRYVAAILAPGERVALIKIDVEGLEDKVLAGLSDIIATHQPLLLIELTGDSAGERVKTLIAEYGYDPIHEIFNNLRFGTQVLPLRLLHAAMQSVSYQLRPLQAVSNRIYPMTVTAPRGVLKQSGLV